MKNSLSKLGLLALMLVFVFIVAACSNTQNKDQNQTASNQFQSTTDASSNSQINNAYPIEIVDVTNTIVKLEEEPKRIVTLVPSDTEIVFAINGQQKLVGVNAFSDYPAEAAAIESIGDAAINVEAVVALEPDLVLASQSMNGDYITTLRDLGLTVYAADPLTYDETMKHIETLGQLVNHQADANVVVSHMQDVKQNIQAKVTSADKVKVYLEFSAGWTIGKDTFLDDLITIAGGKNISGSQSGWYEVNGEAVVEANPSVIIYPNFGEPESSILKGIQERPGWQVIDAVKQNRLVEVSNEPLVRVGPRLANGLKELAKAIHPELFN